MHRAAQIRGNLLLVFTHASVSGRWSSPRHPAGIAGEGTRLGRGRRHARGAAGHELSRGRPRFPGLPAPRLARKVAPGYRGFVVEFGPEVTLEEDLARRDLTINAIAQAADGSLIDPYGGGRDLDSRILRHVSPAFAEDPVRVLRVARFAARFASLGFRVAPETAALMRGMVERHEVDALVAERVWQETEKALREPAASTFFKVLRECGALARIYPEIEALFGVPQPARWHPEIDTGVHTLMVLDQAVALSADPRVRFAALVHDLGKATTPQAQG